MIVTYILGFLQLAENSFIYLLFIISFYDLLFHFTFMPMVTVDVLGEERFSATAIVA